MRLRSKYDRCIRCGKGIPWGTSVCQECNPGGLPAPSPTQYHATVFIVVFAVLGLIALVALLIT